MIVVSRHFGVRTRCNEFIAQAETTIFENIHVNDHRLKAVASSYGLKPDWWAQRADSPSLHNFEVVVGDLGLLILDILLPHCPSHCRSWPPNSLDSKDPITVCEATDIPTATCASSSL